MSPSSPSKDVTEDGIEEDELPTLLEPQGYHASTCGYCSPLGERSPLETSKSYGMIASQMSPRVYQSLIDRGWRRSGTYIYHPDMANTCCPQYTIRLCCSPPTYPNSSSSSSSSSSSPLGQSITSPHKSKDPIAFDAGKDKKLRKLMNRWKRFIVQGEKPGESEETVTIHTGPAKDGKAEAVDRGRKTNGGVTNSMRSGLQDDEASSSSQAGEQTSVSTGTGSTKARKAKNPAWVKSKPGLQKSVMEAYDYVKEIRAPEKGKADACAVHTFEVKLVPAEATDESFGLYDRYQQKVHGDAVGKNKISSYDRFLCSNPLGKQRIPYPTQPNAALGLPEHYGCYHQQWRVDGVLIAFSVLDILPGCVSSVYFVWDPDYAWASLGKLSAVREAALARQFVDAGMTSMGWLYMGYYIHSCQKMRYKGDYEPSFLLDPGTNLFHPLANVRSLLEAHPIGYTPFQQVEAAPSNTTHIVAAQDSSASPSAKRRKVDASWPSPPPPSFLDPASIPKSTLKSLLIYMDGSLVQMKFIRFVQPVMVERLMAELISAVGNGLLATAETSDRGVFVALG